MTPACVFMPVMLSDKLKDCHESATTLLCYWDGMPRYMACGWLCTDRLHLLTATVCRHRQVVCAGVLCN